MNPSNKPATFQVATFIRAASLTAELTRHRAPFSVRLNFLGQSQLDADELAYFPNLHAGADVFVREVCLCLADEPVVSACSVCLNTSAYWRNILDCGTRSLGAQLFGGEMPHLQRSAFAFVHLPPQHRLLAGFAQSACPARRSAFTAEAEVLLLTECFLPALHRYEY